MNWDTRLGRYPKIRVELLSAMRPLIRSKQKKSKKAMLLELAAVSIITTLS